MASSYCWKLQALLKKNFLQMKRNILTTIFEFLFPIILMLVIVGLRYAFPIETKDFKKEEKNLDFYMLNKSTSNIDIMQTPEVDPVNGQWLGLSIIPPLSICSMFNNQHKPRPKIASVGIPNEIKERIIYDSMPYQDILQLQINSTSFIDFDSIEKMEEYIKSPLYGSSDYPLVCFGMRFSYDETNKKYNYSLHYFDSDNVHKGGIFDVRDLRSGLFDQFQTGPDITSYSLYRNNGFSYLMKLVNEYILKKETGDKNAELNFGVAAMEYIDYRNDTFGELLGYMITIFIVIAYMCPLCLYVFRMVNEKETKSKEGMKIMGLGEGEYFLSYFIQYLIVGIPVALINAYLLTFVLTFTPYLYLFLTFFLWSLDVFAMIYFFQSFIDKTRLAIVLSILIYFVMYCLSLSCMYEFSDRTIKLVLSVFPAVSINLGILLLSKFEYSFKRYHLEYFMDKYTNYSIALMYLMLVVDFFIFLFLGFYLQNVLPHDFGIKKPWYFLCTSDYWCGPKKENKAKNNKDKNLEVEKKLNEKTNEKPANKKTNPNARTKKSKSKLNDTNNNNNDNLNFNSNNSTGLKLQSQSPENPDSQVPILKKKKKKKIKIKKKIKRKIKKKKKTQLKPAEDNDQFVLIEDLYNGNPNFQSEDIYKGKIKKADVLQIRNIVKVFGDGKKAVDHVNLNFYKDEIFALLGHNGAGKTTLISMLTGLYEATEGKVLYDGINILEGTNMDEFRSKLGICPQHDILFDDLSIREHLEMFSTFKGVESDKVENEVNKVLHDFQIEDIQNMIAKNLSAGQRRKLSICIALTGGSKVIFLDEPSSGMDITSRRNLWEILKRQSENKIIILTTHYMEEASVLGKRIGIINAGQMKCIGSPLFLIEKFGKFMSLNITKEENADNDKIVDFIKNLSNDVEYEILSEEIMFRIPKSSNNNKNSSNDNNYMNVNNNNNKSNFNFSQFFELLDNNLSNLKIKSYSASMPTLEDVFLNVAAEDNNKVKNTNQNNNNNNDGEKEVKNSEIIDIEKNDEILFNTDFREDYSKKSKFCNDFSSNFKRRFLLTIRDVKGFALEMLCPIILVLIGLAVSKVEMSRPDLPLHMDISSVGKQNVMYAGIEGVSNINDYFLTDLVNVTSKPLENYGNFKQTEKKKAVKTFVEKMFDLTKSSEDSGKKEVDMTAKDYSGYYGALLMLNEQNNNYQFIELLNARVRHSVPIYTHFLLKKIVEKAAGHKVDIEFVHYPMPYTYQLGEQSGSGNNIIIVFFVAIAFSLIPANFVTVLAKEKVNNSKHLMRVSGMNITAYWIVNYIYELVKYYFTAGICVLLLWAFDKYEDYLYILYLTYGPGMISLTYVMSFWFSNESTAQNAVILLNFLVGAMGSLVVMTLRSVKKFKSFAKILEYILAIIPTFCFDFGYDLLLNKMAIYMVDYPTEFMTFKNDQLIKKFNLLLSVVLFASAEILIYTVLLIIVEANSYSFRKVAGNRLESGNINDSMVLKEIERANEDVTNNNNNNNPNTHYNEDGNEVGININGIEDVNDEEDSKLKKYSVRIKNLKKIYKSSLCSKNSENIEAIKNLNFCIEPGECFGLLGLNGAGKTTTFKCITQELSPSNGQIFIYGKDIYGRFSDLSQLFGYCPQFDAIFEYMTVKENLEFYARIKGVKLELLDQLVQAMIAEMSLDEFTNKISGRLSGGNKRKLAVAISMLCNPPIILLDEPSTGMDPEARRFMWSVIHKMSTKGKKSSVIMTTHSMDEAETLCRRMGIMVNGEFVCLGRANQIKEKYGYGYEADIRIKPMTEKQVEDIYIKYGLDKNLEINDKNIEEVLRNMGRDNYINELTNNRLGSKIIRDIKLNGNISIHSLISWIFFVENALKFISKGKNYFDEIILSEHIDNNFLFKMKKGQQHKSIGFFFGLFEGSKDECFVTEYSIQQTSLEQIFNKFAGEQIRDKEKEKKNKNKKSNEEDNNEIIGDDDNEYKKEIKIDDQLLYDLVRNY